MIELLCHCQCEVVDRQDAETLHRVQQTEEEEEGKRGRMGRSDLQCCESNKFSRVFFLGACGLLEVI